MKPLKIFVFAFLSIFVILLFSSCDVNEVVVTDPISETAGSQKINKLTSDENTIVIKDSTNYIVLTMDSDKVVKAEYAYCFGNYEAASGMLDYYEKNGFDVQYKSGYVDGVYLIMEMADGSKYLGLDEDEIKAAYGDNIMDGYFEPVT